MVSFRGLANLALQAIDKPSRAMKGNRRKMTPIAAYIVTETPLGWSAPGLFKWEKAQKELLIRDRKCTVQIDQVFWAVTELDQAAESLRIFEFRHENRPKVRVLMPLAHGFAGLILSQDSLFQIKSAGAYWEVLSETGEKQLRTIDCWKDSELAMGQRHRIELYRPEAKILAAIVYGVILDVIAADHSYFVSRAGVGAG